MRKKTRVRALGIGENGFRNFTNRVRPIKTPDDLKGLKVRTMENPAHMAMVRALGASPTPIAWAWPPWLSPSTRDNTQLPS